MIEEENTPNQDLADENTGESQARLWVSPSYAVVSTRLDKKRENHKTGAAQLFAASLQVDSSTMAQKYPNQNSIRVQW